MHLSLGEALSFYNSQLNTYYTLWVFFFTASIGIVGFLYGNEIARDSLLVKVSASAIYFMLIIGNHHAISTTNSVLKEVKSSIQQASVNSPKSSEKVVVVMDQAINKLQDSSINFWARIKKLLSDVFYMLMVVSVLGGIWGSGFIAKPDSALHTANKSLKQDK